MSMRKSSHDLMGFLLRFMLWRFDLKYGFDHSEMSRRKLPKGDGGSGIIADQHGPVHPLECFRLLRTWRFGDRAPSTTSETSPKVDAGPRHSVVSWRYDCSNRSKQGSSEMRMAARSPVSRPESSIRY